MHSEFDIIWTESCDSTNDALRKRIRELGNRSVVAALRQENGRGRGDHKWYSPAGENLLFSMLLKFGRPRPGDAGMSGGPEFVESGGMSGGPESRENESPLKASDSALISCAIALGIRDFLLTEGVEARIKWPNDIWVGDKKICGLLIDNRVSGNYLEDSIIGTGLNLNTTRWSGDLPNPVSLKELTGRSYELRGTLERVLEKISRRLSLMENSDGRDSLQGEFEKYMFRLP